MECDFIIEMLVSFVMVTEKETLLFITGNAIRQSNSL